MGLQRFPVPDFSGGLNLIDAPGELQPNEAQSLLNVHVHTRGELSKRGGTLNRTGTGAPTNCQIDNIFVWDVLANGAIASIGGNIYSLVWNGGTQKYDFTLLFTSSSPITTGAPDPWPWTFVPMKDGAGTEYLWCQRGVTDVPKKITAALAVSNWAGTPPNGGVILQWKNMMVVTQDISKPDRVYFSDIGNPETPITGYGTRWVDLVSYSPDYAYPAGDHVTGAKVFGDSLYIFKNRSVWKITNPAPPWDNVRIANVGVKDLGGRSKFLVAAASDKLYFANSQGLFSLRPRANLAEAVTEETEKIRPMWTWLSERVGAVPSYYGVNVLDRLFITSDGRILISVSLVSTAQPNFPNPSYLIEGAPDLTSRGEGESRVSSMGFSLHDVSTGCMTNMPVIGLAGASCDGTAKILELFSPDTDTDLGVAISNYWIGGWRGLLTEEPIERIRRLNLVSTGSVTVDLFQDYDLGTPKFTGTLSGGGFGKLAPEARGRYHAVKLRDLSQACRVSNLELVLRGGKEHSK